MNTFHKVIEIGDNVPISIPIIKFPPFKLRSELIEKEPSIWLHLLESYVNYFQYVMSKNIIEQLDETSNEQLCIFVKTYLHEFAEEEGKLLSLDINNDILEKLKQLRACVFLLIKKCGLTHLKISAESLWDLVKIYVKQNPTSVRSLIDGSLIPSINTQKVSLNRVYQIHQYIKKLLESNKFTRIDLNTLESLLSANKHINTKFTDNFCSIRWVELLELIYAKIQDVFLVEWSKKIGIITYLSISEDKIVCLSKELCIFSLDTLAEYPLFGSILLHSSFQKRFPTLQNKLTFLLFTNSCDNTEDTFNREDEILRISELFPDLTHYQINVLLERYNNNVELIVDNLFEDPYILESIPLEPIKTKIDENLTPNSSFNTQLKVTDRIIKKEEDITSHVPDEVRNKTLERVLKLLYSENEDERDDTYDDAEATSVISQRINVDNIEDQELTINDKIEIYLWELLKKNELAFDRKSRGTKIRKALKEETGWSDEQIEGWARMLERNPELVHILEDKYMFRGNFKLNKSSYVKNTNTNERSEFKIVKNSLINNVDQPKKKDYTRNGKNKNSKVNHNRKVNHMEKTFTSEYSKK